MFGAHHALRRFDCNDKPMSEGEVFFDTQAGLCTATTVVDAGNQISTFDED